MASVIKEILMLPIKLIGLLLEFLGRGLVIFLGLVLFGIGALFCFMGPLIIIGAPFCLFGALIVIKAF